uniref:Peptidase S1 domain-containing protein n=1 Tax=Clytia hemisphaerica TaxID=252671 RepID=A0A7M5XMW8_9CNID
MNADFLFPVFAALTMAKAGDVFNDFHVCGKVKSIGAPTPLNTRIFGGVNAKPGDLPWQIAIRGGNSGLPFCGATLISKKWAVSAAHCRIKVGQQIVLGANDLGKTNEGILL